MQNRMHIKIPNSWRKGERGRGREGEREREGEVRSIEVCYLLIKLL